MHATVGDTLLIHSGIVGQHERTAEILEVMEEDGEAPAYLVRFADGDETVLSPDPDTVIKLLQKKE
ncbi:DUF1918 domain-containing protein [Streptomyces himalayensis]|uniref:DUF1918 domain-containing protein n=1 Tax=Streptomyces himalayensis subsp. himalayensis TaxID=2756131 RepID=A0A7W0DV07_9ACTN|nr:DUF1918 domain-containing protein [Streptomyces himalayensis]MBA2951757.1 DUF1918 domain-containing protein [Streptomyces himalayensis subsp. himalayensis]